MEENRADGQTSIDQLGDIIEFKVPLMTAFTIAKAMAKIEVANTIMQTVMTAYRNMCDVEQQKMDLEMAAICEAHGFLLPKPYEFRFNHETLVLTIRKVNA